MSLEIEAPELYEQDKHRPRKEKKTICSINGKKVSIWQHNKTYWKGYFNDDPNCIYEAGSKGELIKDMKEF